MKKHNFFSYFLLCGLFLPLYLTGCHSPEAPAATDSIPATETSIVAESDTTTESSVAIKTLDISILNLSNVDIGMVAVIDPVTGEQMNLDSLSPGESLSLESNWPVDTVNFQWALYNTDGELCIDASTDIADAQTTVALLLTGDDTIENVEVIAE